MKDFICSTKHFFPLYLFPIEIGKPTTSMFLKCLYIVQLTRAELVPRFSKALCWWTMHSEAVEVKILNVLSWLQPLFSLLVQPMLFLSYFLALLWSSAFLSCDIQVHLNSRIDFSLIRNKVTLAIPRKSYPDLCPPQIAHKLRQSLGKWQTDYFWS